MGKNSTIYLKDEVIELLGEMEGKGTLINSLILDHFSNDEDILVRKLKALERESNFIRKKLEAKQNQRLKLETLRQRKAEVSRGEIIRRKKLENWKQKHESEEITEEQYMKAFNKKGKFDPNLIEASIREVKHGK